MRLTSIASNRSAVLEPSVSGRSPRPAASHRFWDTGSPAGTSAVRVMGCYTSERGRVAGQEPPGSGSVSAPLTARPAQAAPWRYQAWYAVGQRQKGSPPQLTKHEVCKRQERGLAGRRASRSIRDKQVSRRRSTMDDTSDRAVCQTKDFTILSPLRVSIISIGVSCLREPNNQCPVYRVGSPYTRATLTCQ